MESVGGAEVGGEGGGEGEGESEGEDEDKGEALSLLITFPIECLCCMFFFCRRTQGKPPIWQPVLPSRWAQTSGWLTWSQSLASHIACVSWRATRIKTAASAAISVRLRHRRLLQPGHRPRHPTTRHSSLHCHRHTRRHTPKLLPARPLPGRGYRRLPHPRRAPLALGRPSLRLQW